MRVAIKKVKEYSPLDGFIPNPKLKLLEQVSEVMRFKHYSIRTERTYREWIRRFILFHGKRHPREMGAVEVGRFLSDLAVEHRVASSVRCWVLSVERWKFVPSTSNSQRPTSNIKGPRAGGVWQLFFL